MGCGVPGAGLPWGDIGCGEPEGEPPWGDIGCGGVPGAWMPGGWVPVGWVPYGDDGGTALGAPWGAEELCSGPGAGVAVRRGRSASAVSGGGMGTARDRLWATASWMAPAI